MPILQTLLTYLTSHPQPLRTPSSALELAHHTPAFLDSSESAKDAQETWLLYEQLMLASLTTQDDVSARRCLQRLGDRFGGDSARVQALAGLYEEAMASGRVELEGVLKRYEEVLAEDATNMPTEKRRIALLLSLQRTEDAITALTKLLAHSPTDAESWSKLAELYRGQGLYAQSVFCLEEVLLIHPNAYNIHARLGETSYLSAGTGANVEALMDAVRYFCRSVELCEWYLRGWYGLRVATERLKEVAGSAKTGKAEAEVDVRTMERLNEAATKRLAEIVLRSKAGEKGWTGFDAAEVEAARELLELAGAAVR